jgi:hypothetical protein
MLRGDTEDTVRHVLILKSEAEPISKNISLDIEEFSHKILGSEPYVEEMAKTANWKGVLPKRQHMHNPWKSDRKSQFYPFELRNLGNNRYYFACTNNPRHRNAGPNWNRNCFEKSSIRV